MSTTSTLQQEPRTRSRSGQQDPNKVFSQYVDEQALQRARRQAAAVHEEPESQCDLNVNMGPSVGGEIPPTSFGVKVWNDVQG